MKKLLLVMVTILMAICCQSSESEGYLMTFTFEADVTSVDSELSSAFNTTQTVSGYYTFETTTEDSEPDSSTGRFLNAINDLEVTIESSTYAADNGRITVINGELEDRYIVYSTPVTGPHVSGLTPSEFRLDLIDWDHLVFDDDSMPESPPPLLEMDFNGGYLSFEGAYYVLFEFTDFKAIPDLSAVFLLGSASLIGFAVRRKQSSK